MAGRHDLHLGVPFPQNLGGNFNVDSHELQVLLLTPEAS